jgi:hypothetical protein
MSCHAPLFGDKMVSNRNPYLPCPCEIQRGHYVKKSICHDVSGLVVEQSANLVAKNSCTGSLFLQVSFFFVLSYFRVFVIPMPTPIRNRIQSHRRIRAGDLVPHELNFRLHPERQRAALQALYHEVGFARSLLAYELPNGRLKLIDGHLRRDLDPDMEVDAEVLDVTDDEARALLLSIDPLAALAETQAQIHQRLLARAPVVSLELQAAWRAAEVCLATSAVPPARPVQPGPAQFLILLTCRDEKHQVELLTRFHGEGLECRALLS